MRSCQWLAFAALALLFADYRPLTGQLFGLGVDAPADTASLWLIDLGRSGATLVGAAINLGDDTGAALDLPDPAVVGYGIDFTPVTDRRRLYAIDLSNAAAVGGS
jgi:hypothetical protein